jgi:hypothetical protein
MHDIERRFVNFGKILLARRRSTGIASGPKGALALQPLNSPAE